MPALAAILTLQILFALSCLLFLLYLITIYILRRPGLGPGHLSFNALFHQRRWNLKPTPPPTPLPLNLSSQQGDLERNAQPTYHNPFDASPTTTSSSSPMSSSAIDCMSQSSGILHPETSATAPITWRDPWRWRFGTGDSRRDRSGSESGVAEERRTGSESPGLSPLGLGKYFFEGGVGVRDM